MAAIPLIRFLTGAGEGSRRECFQLITSGAVRVNGTPATAVTAPVNPERDRIEVRGRRVEKSQRKVYLALNKPRGVVSTTSDERGRPTVLDYVPAPLRGLRLFPVGRLDADTTGLILLTNDGELALRLTHPRFEADKEYEAAVDAPLTMGQLRQLEAGVVIEGQKTAPARVRALRGPGLPRYSVVVHEGRKRQVRLMFAAVGRSVRSLRRVRILTLTLGDLREGATRALTPSELNRLKRR